MDRKNSGKKETIGTTRTAPGPLNPGDIICPSCKGTGWLTGKKTEWEYTCKECWGAGKLDWIEAIMGKPAPFRTLKGNWTMEMNEDVTALHSIDLDSEILDALSKEIAEKMDEEIIGNIIEFSVTQSKLK